ncbi:hypothetical protein ALC57_06576 [Trachymyrmex cornetzi]|uniref:Uncharacterized protein n=1 Tax=Trachymyrmex cornetzi TaxID=471704 RepID=A0A151J899_9HYME|nr:hypothetical protein ALC57_06576 [Trachymyrmex cornetzi]
MLVWQNQHGRGEYYNNDSGVLSLADDTIGNMLSDEFPNDLQERIETQAEKERARETKRKREQMRKREK